LSQSSEAAKNIRKKVFLVLCCFAASRPKDFDFEQFAFSEQAPGGPDEAEDDQEPEAGPGQGAQGRTGAVFFRGVFAGDQLQAQPGQNRCCQKRHGRGEVDQGGEVLTEPVNDRQPTE